MLLAFNRREIFIFINILRVYYFKFLIAKLRFLDYNYTDSINIGIIMPIWNAAERSTG